MGTDGRGEAGTRTLLLGGSVVALLGLGWFALSRLVLGTATGDAVVEALGVVLALLIVASIIGAVRGAVRDRGPEEGGDDPRPS